MRTLAILIVAAVVALPPLATAAPTLKGLPAVGQILPDGLDGPDDWAFGSRGTWCGKDDRCFFTRVFKPTVVAVILTEPVAGDTAGAEQVTQVLMLPLGKGDELANCQTALTQTVVIGVLNRARKETRAYTTDGHALIASVRHYRGRAPCSLGEP